MEGTACLFTGLTTGQHLTGTLQRLLGLGGVRPLLSYANFVSASLILAFNSL